jgi:ubiquinone/menaquinone biosynthesis C-methylase UbiE
MEQNLTVTTTLAYKAAEVYEQFIVPGIFRYWTPLLLQRAAPQPGERVLDVACGTGVVARTVVPLVRNRGKVVGLDINPAMLEVACKQYSDHCEEIDWREGQAEDLPFSNESFDLVTCQQGLQFFKNRPKAAEEMHRVLRQKGRVAIEVWQSIDHNPGYKIIFEAIASVFKVPISDVATPYSYGDAGELGRLLENAGFQSVKVEPLSQDVHFSEANRFVELTIRGAAAVIPAFSKMDVSLQGELFANAAQEVEGFIKDHVFNGILTFPMYANIATGIR